MKNFLSLKTVVLLKDTEKKVICISAVVCFILFCSVLLGGCIMDNSSIDDAQKYLTNKYNSTFEYKKVLSTSKYGSDVYYEFKDTKENYFRVRSYKYNHYADNYCSYLYDEQIANFLNNQLGNNYYCQCDTKKYYFTDSFSCWQDYLDSCWQDYLDNAHTYPRFIIYTDLNINKNAIENAFLSFRELNKANVKITQVKSLASYLKTKTYDTANEVCTLCFTYEDNSFNWN